MNQLTHLSADAASVLLAAIWQGTVMTASVALILRMLPGIPAAVRSVIWTVVFVVVLGLHFVLPAASPQVGPTHAIHLSSGWSIALVALWLAFSVYRAAEFIFGAFRLAQIARNANPIDAQQISAGSRGYILCTSPDVDRPSVLGFWTPRILLPVGLVEVLTPDELQQVLLHETEHLRRSDDWTNLLQKIALVLFPLNPALFWVERRLCLERELACDDRVLAASLSRKAYATCLTRIAEHGILKRGMALALGAFGKQSELATRVHRILSRPASRMSCPATRFATVALLAGMTAGSVTLAHSPRWISFAPDTSSNAVASKASPVLPGISYAPKATLVKAVVAASPQPRLLKMQQHHRSTAIPIRPIWIETPLRSAPDFQPHVTLTVAGEQVHPIYVPAIARYAALRTSNGWIIIQL